MSLTNPLFTVPVTVKEDINQLKLIKESLVADHSNLIFLKREYVLSPESSFKQFLATAVHQCMMLIHSVESHLINYATYISLFDHQSITENKQEFSLQLESLTQISKMLYLELDKYRLKYNDLNQTCLEVA